MMKKTYSLLATDLDGTLMRDGNTLSGANIDAVRRAAAAGKHIMPVSGRPYRMIEPVLNELALDRCYVVAMSGADIREWPSGKSVFSMLLTPEQIQAVYDFTLTQKCVFQAFRLDGRFYALARNDATDRYGKYHSVDYEVCTLEEIKTFGDVCKCMLTASKEDIPAIAAAAKARLGEDLRPEVIWPTLLDVNAAGGNKATALRDVARRLGLKMDQVAAIGDELVDLPMLQASALAIVMGNAREAVKVHADVIAPSNEEDGVAWAIEEYIL